MKHKKVFYKILIASIGLIMISCNNDYLEKYPEDKFTNETFWKSNNDFRTYALGLYDFDGFGVGNNSNVFKFNSDETCKSNMVQDSRIFNRTVVPATGGGWSWSRLRDRKSTRLNSSH